MAKTSTSFVKGDPRINRDGRPKEPWTMTGLYKEALDEESETGVPRKIIVARKLVQLAERGDVVAIKELGNRIDGMPQQKTDLTTNGKDINPVLVKFIDADNRNSE